MRRHRRRDYQWLYRQGGNKDVIQDCAYDELYTYKRSTVMRLLSSCHLSLPFTSFLCMGVRGFCELGPPATSCVNSLFPWRRFRPHTYSHSLSEHYFSALLFDFTCVVSLGYAPFALAPAHLHPIVRTTLFATIRLVSSHYYLFYNGLQQFRPHKRSRRITNTASRAIQRTSGRATSEQRKGAARICGVTKRTERPTGTTNPYRRLATPSSRLPTTVIFCSI